MDLQNDLHTCTAVFTAAAGQAERLAGKVTTDLVSDNAHVHASETRQGLLVSRHALWVAACS